MRLFLFLTISLSFFFSLSASADQVKCGASSYYAFSKCSPSKRKKLIKKLFKSDLNQIFTLMDLIEEETQLSFTAESKKINKISQETQKIVSKLFVKRADSNLISSLTQNQKELALILVSNCKDESKCNINKSNKIIDDLLLDHLKTEKLASEVKDAKSI